MFIYILFLNKFSVIKLFFLNGIQIFTLKKSKSQKKIKVVIYNRFNHRFLKKFIKFKYEYLDEGYVLGPAFSKDSIFPLFLMFLE